MRTFQKVRQIFKQNVKKFTKFHFSSTSQKSSVIKFSRRDNSLQIKKFIIIVKIVKMLKRVKTRFISIMYVTHKTLTIRPKIIFNMNKHFSRFQKMYRKFFVK